VNEPPSVIAAIGRLYAAGVEKTQFKKIKVLRF